MKLVTAPVVTIDHWIARRYTAGDVIERWSIVNADGKTMLTYDNEIEPRETCKGYGWVIGGVTDSGWIADDDQAAEAPEFEMCPTCCCCSIGRMGTCVGGCEPNGDRREHDRPARAERDAAGDAEG